MKKTETIKIMGMIAAAYPNMKEINEVQVNLWHECLQDLELNMALMMIKKHIMESTFPPTIADIRKQVAETISPQIDAGEAWGEVVKAISSYGYYRSKEALESMSPSTAATVKNMGWKDICHSEKPDVVRGQFMKIYDTMVKRENQQALLPNEFRGEVKAFSEKLMLGGDKK